MTADEARAITNRWEMQGFVYSGCISYSWMRAHTIPEDEVPEHPCPKCGNEDYTELMYYRGEDTRVMHYCTECGAFYEDDEALTPGTSSDGRGEKDQS